ncbi:MAG: hypothetical protein K0R18_448 [Bacillales bacterium]|jgi:hypothetical protein|nr:hypothetical protein [Bacillales bacterium]
MAKGKNSYNPRLNNNSSRKQSESELINDSQPIQQAPIEESQPEKESAVDEVFVEKEVELNVEEELKTLDTVYAPIAELDLPPINDEWLERVIAKEQSLDIEKINLKLDLEEETKDIVVPVKELKKKKVEPKKDEAKKIPHYVFQRNSENSTIERISNLPKGGEEKVSNMDELKIYILKGLLEDVTKSIPKLEVEIEIQKIIVDNEIEPDKVNLAQRKLDTLRDNLESMKARKKAIEKLVGAYKE